MYTYTHIRVYICRHACKNVRVYPFILVQIYMASLPQKIEFPSISLWEIQIPHRCKTDLKTRELQCSSCFWPVEVSNGRLGVSHYCSDSVLFGLACSLAPESTADLVTLKFKANELPHLAISPHPVQMSTSSPASTGQKRSSELYLPHVQYHSFTLTVNVTFFLCEAKWAFMVIMLRYIMN
jgi:hypothetical protein